MYAQPTAQVSIDELLKLGAILFFIPDPEIRAQFLPALMRVSRAATLEGQVSEAKRAFKGWDFNALYDFHRGNVVEAITSSIDGVHQARFEEALKTASEGFLTATFIGQQKANIAMHVFRLMHPEHSYLSLLPLDTYPAKLHSLTSEQRSQYLAIEKQLSGILRSISPLEVPASEGELASAALKDVFEKFNAGEHFFDPMGFVDWAEESKRSKNIEVLRLGKGKLHAQETVSLLNRYIVQAFFAKVSTLSEDEAIAWLTTWPLESQRYFVNLLTNGETLNRLPKDFDKAEAPFMTDMAKKMKEVFDAGEVRLQIIDRLLVTHVIQPVMEAYYFRVTMGIDPVNKETAIKALLSKQVLPLQEVALDEALTTIGKVLKVGLDAGAKVPLLGHTFEPVRESLRALKGTMSSAGHLVSKSIPGKKKKQLGGYAPFGEIFQELKIAGEGLMPVWRQEFRVLEDFDKTMAVWLAGRFNGKLKQEGGSLEIKPKHTDGFTAAMFERAYKLKEFDVSYSDKKQTARIAFNARDFSIGKNSEGLYEVALRPTSEEKSVISDEIVNRQTFREVYSRALVKTAKVYLDAKEVRDIERVDLSQEPMHTGEMKQESAKAVPDEVIKIAAAFEKVLGAACVLKRIRQGTLENLLKASSVSPEAWKVGSRTKEEFIDALNAAVNEMLKKNDKISTGFMFSSTVSEKASQLSAGIYAVLKKGGFPEFAVPASDFNGKFELRLSEVPVQVVRATAI